MRVLKTPLETRKNQDYSVLDGEEDECGTVMLVRTRSKVLVEAADGSTTSVETADGSITGSGATVGSAASRGVIIYSACKSSERS